MRGEERVEFIAGKARRKEASRTIRMGVGE
jgi:hypothetical protein